MLLPLTVLLLILLPGAQASAATLKIASLNCNGLSDSPNLARGIQAFLLGFEALSATMNNSSRGLRPHAFFLSDTRQTAGNPLNLPIEVLKEYSVFSEYAANNRSNTGVALLVHKSLSVRKVIRPAQNDAAAERLIAVDVAIPHGTIGIRTIRLISLYAPTNQRTTLGAYATQLQAFWENVRSVTTEAPYWILGGDVNAHLFEWESQGRAMRTADHAPLQQRAYSDFLQAAEGRDNWASQRQVLIERDWTHTPLGNGAGSRRIIDRFVTSMQFTYRRSITGSAIETTDHRPVHVEVVCDGLVPSTRHTVDRRRLRLRQPDKQDADQRFERLRSHLESPTLAKIAAEPIKSDTEYDGKLRQIGDMFITACNKSFKLRHHQHSNSPRVIANAACDTLGRRKRTVGRMIMALRELRYGILINTSTTVAAEHIALTRDTRPFRLTPTMSDLTSHRNALSDQLSKARKEAFKTQSTSRQNTFAKALQSGSVKRLIDPTFQQAPAILAPPGRPEAAAHTPDGRLRVFTDYFRDLVQGSSTPFPSETSAPTEGDDVDDLEWLRSPASQRMQEQSNSDPFQWPKKMELADLTYILAKGNPKPSPGPDGWEKWALRQAGTPLQSAILTLANYTIENNYFPDVLKQNFVAPHFKRNDPTDPSNYRGITYAQLLNNIVVAWYTVNLQRYVWRKKLLPPTQCAVQRGVQQSDITTFLDQADYALGLAGQTVWAIKRDQMKSYDNLSPRALPHAARFYGLPASVVAFERARNHNVSMRIMSTDGQGEPYYITLRTKQGCHASPIHYCLIMGMANHWLLDDSSPAEARDIVTIRTVNGLAGTPHVQADQEKLQFLTVEAMDDSIIASTTLDGLRRLTLVYERFQAAYGMETSWGNDKTTAFTMGKPLTAPPDHVAIDSTDGQHQVLCTDDPTFLKIHLRKQHDLFDTLRARIDDVRISPAKQFPMSILLRVLSSCVKPRIESRLSHQPQMQRVALRIDKYVANKIADALGAPQTASELLSLPWHKGGFDFPSVVRMNAKVAIRLILRALNHHLKPLAVMASITLANWQCGQNGCIPPLERLVRLPRGTTVMLPPTWQGGAEALKRTGFRMINTRVERDTMSFTSFRHWYKLLMEVSPAMAANLYPAQQMRLVDLSSVQYAPITTWSQALNDHHANSPKDMKRAAKALALSHKTIRLSGIIPHPDLGVAEGGTKRMNSLLDTFKRALRPGQGSNNVWATDGSWLQAQEDSPASVTAAVTGPRTATLKIVGHSATSMHGELLGLALGLYAAQDYSKLNPALGQPKVVSDYLSAVRVYNEMTSPGFVFDPMAMRNRAGKAYYRMLHWFSKQNMSHTVDHVKAHTDATDDLSLLNDEADRLAKAAHGQQTTLFEAPTVFMEHYVLHHPQLGYVEDDWEAQLDSVLVGQQFARQRPALRDRLTWPTRDVMPQADWMLKKSPRGWPAKVLYLARAGRLQSNRIAAEMGRHDSPACSYCDCEEQDNMHIYWDCPRFEPMRQAAHAAMVKRVPRRGPGDTQQAWEARKAAWTAYAPTILQYREETPLTRYFLGQLPPYPPELDIRDLAYAFNKVITLTSTIYSTLLRENPHFKSTGDAMAEAIQRRVNKAAKATKAREAVRTGEDAETGSDTETDGEGAPRPPKRAIPWSERARLRPRPSQAGRVWRPPVQAPTPLDAERGHVHEPITEQSGDGSSAVLVGRTTTGASDPATPPPRSKGKGRAEGEHTTEELAQNEPALPSLLTEDTHTPHVTTSSPAPSRKRHRTPEPLSAPAPTPALPDRGPTPSGKIPEGMSVEDAIFFGHISRAPPKIKFKPNKGATRTQPGLAPRTASGSENSTHSLALAESSHSPHAVRLIYRPTSALPINLPSTSVPPIPLPQPAVPPQSSTPTPTPTDDGRQVKKKKTRPGRRELQ